MASDVLIETTIATAEPKKIAFPAAAETIAAAAEKYKALTIVGINDRKGLAAVHDARMEVKAARVAVEKTREALKKESLEYGRRVDAEAKRLTALLEPIEADLVAKEVAIEQEKKRIASAEREANEKRLRDRLVALQAVQSIALPSVIEAMTDDEFAAHLGAETAAFELRQAELAAIEAENQAAEDERQRKLAEEEAALRQQREELAEQQRQIESQRQEALRKQEAELAEQRERLAKVEREQQAERDRLAKIEAYRIAKELEELEAKRRAEQAELDRQRQEIEAAQRKLADEQAAKLKAEQEAAAKAEADRLSAEEQARLDALKPVRDKLNAYSDAVAAVELPDVDAEIQARILEARMAFSLAVEGLAN